MNSFSIVEVFRCLKTGDARADLPPRVQPRTPQAMRNPLRLAPKASRCRNGPTCRGLPYTKEAKKAKVKGIVLVQGVIGLDGRITNLRVVKALGYGLDESALKTLKTCNPAIGPNGEPFPGACPH
jgi:TonB family protein